MATYSTGISVWFDRDAGGTVSFSEVTGLSWAGPSGTSKGRDAVWTDDAGSINVSWLGSGPGTGNWNDLGTLRVTGGGLDISWPAVCGQVQYSAELNGFTRKSVSFEVLR